MRRNWKRAAIGLAVLLGCMMLMSKMPAEAEEAGAYAITAPEIVITREGANKTFSLGGEITFDYTNHLGTMFEVSVKPNGREVFLSYALDSVTDMGAAAKTEEQMDSLRWGAIDSPPVSIQPVHDGCYVVYVKAEAGTQKYYARSGGIVVDTARPVIKEAASGEAFVQGQTYPIHTKFVVEDANLDIVKINEQVVTPEEGGEYRVAIQDNSTSCVIRAIDKAGNETICSITVSGNETPPDVPPDTPPDVPPDTPPDVPPDTPPDVPPEIPDEKDIVIAENGTYTLQAGVKYHLAAGKWTVVGDMSVYEGDRDFYVSSDGSYSFQKK